MMVRCDVAFCLRLHDTPIKFSITAGDNALLNVSFPSAFLKHKVKKRDQPVPLLKWS